MFEIQMCTVKRETSNGIGSRAVIFIADNDVARLGEMHAYLMLSTGLQAYLQNRRFCISFEDVDVRHRQFSDFLVRCRVDAMRCVLRQVRTYGELVTFHTSFDNRDVSPACGVVFELGLQPFLRFRGLGENQKPRSFTIEPVDDEQCFSRLLEVQIFTQGSIDGLRFLGLRCHRQHTYGLIDNNDARVLKYDSDSIDDLLLWGRSMAAHLRSHYDQCPSYCAKHRTGECPGTEQLSLNEHTCDNGCNDLSDGHQGLHQPDNHTLPMSCGVRRYQGRETRAQNGAAEREQSDRKKQIWNSMDCG